MSLGGRTIFPLQQHARVYCRERNCQRPHLRQCGCPICQSGGPRNQKLYRIQCTKNHPRRLFSGRRLELSNASSTVPRVWRRQPQRISRLLWRQLVPVVWRPDILQQRVQHLGQRLQTFHQTNVFRNMGAMRYCREISMKSQYCTQTI